MEENKIYDSFIHNENIFNLNVDKPLKKEQKSVLEAMHTIQPTFIPYAVEQNTLTKAIKDYYEQNMEIELQNTTADFLKKKNILQIEDAAEDDDLLDYKIRIKKISLIGKQFLLRERVYNGIKEMMEKEQIEKAHNYKMGGEEKDCRIVEFLERKYPLNNK